MSNSIETGNELIKIFEILEEHNIPRKEIFNIIGNLIITAAKISLEEKTKNFPCTR